MTEVLPVQIQSEGQSYLSTSSSLRRSPSSQTSLFIGSTPSYSKNAIRKGQFDEEIDPYSRVSSSSSSSSSSPNSNMDSSIATGSASSFSSNSTGDASDDTASDSDEEMVFPEYENGLCEEPKEQIPTPPTSPEDMSHAVPTPVHLKRNNSLIPDIIFLAEDDSAIKQEPSRHVDYLSHEWREEDIWSSWKHIVSKRKVYGEKSRLENASWRTWAKQKNKLKTVPPDSLNWLKDCDVTWLYGPLQTATRYSISEPASEPPSYLSKSNSFLNKKPILKKRSMSEVMLQKSLSASSLVRQAATAVQAQQGLPPRTRIPDSVRNSGTDLVNIIASSGKASSRDGIDYFSSRSTSGLQTPAEQGEKKHIRFDDKVEQCIAVEIKESEYDFEDEEEGDNWLDRQDDDSSDDGILMMKSDKRKPSRSQSSSRRNSTSEPKIIAKLPSTRLKYRTDSPDVPDLPSHSLTGRSWRAGRLSPSPSLETLRPPNPSRNFLLEDDDEDNDDNMAWEPTTAYIDRPIVNQRSPADCDDDLEDEMEDVEEDENSEENDSSYSIMDTDERFGGMRRTESGMFMPYDEAGDVASMTGILGRVVDTVNTARDIAHVIWNVGWRR